jgi:dATP pyrophosphohydrolase
MTERTYKRPESVLVLVHTVTGEVLLLRRRVPDGFWQSVTGSLERDETPAQAARRELREETGLEVGDAALVDCRITNRFPILPAWQGRYAADVTHNTEHVFSLALPTRTAVRLDPLEHLEYRWLGREAALALASSHTDRAAILACVPADAAGFHTQ